MIFIVTNTIGDYGDDETPVVLCVVEGEDPEPALQEFRKQAKSWDDAYSAHCDAFKEPFPEPPTTTKGKLFDTWKVKKDAHVARSRAHRASFVQPRPDLQEFLRSKGLTVSPPVFRRT